MLNLFYVAKEVTIGKFIDVNVHIQKEDTQNAKRNKYIT
jgi:hypothetical protein